MNHYPCSEGERILARLPAADLPSSVLQAESFLNQLRLDPSPPSLRLQQLKEKYEMVLALLESEFVAAIISGDWQEFDEFVDSLKG